MIFLNQTGMGRFGSDEKLESGENWSNSQITVFSALSMYVLVSGILFFFHYPISFFAIIVPIALFIVTTVVNKVGSDEDLMFCTIIAVINALIKLSAIIVYISAFNLTERGGESDSRFVSKPTSTNGEDNDPLQSDPKSIFFYALVGIEASIVFLILFLRCNLRMCRSNIVR